MRTSPTLFPDLAEPEPQALRDGTARLALQTQPPFDHYLFIERSRDRCEALESLKNELPELAASIRVKQGNANTVIQQLCGRKWDGRLLGTDEWEQEFYTKKSEKMLFGEPRLSTSFVSPRRTRKAHRWR